MTALWNPIKRYGWEPWTYLGFLVFPIAAPMLNPEATHWNWLTTAGCILLFLPLHFWSYSTTGRGRLFGVAGMTLLGAIGLVFGLNAGASAFFIYAAAHAGFVGRPRFGWTIVAILLIAVVGFFLVSQIPFSNRWPAFAPAFIFIPIIGAITILENERSRNNARLHLAQGEVERLAVIAERERIGRDLHDLLGHTLSMITLKSQLAAKLSKSDPVAAAREMTEVETISRDALGQVRDAVRGYRAKGIAAEIAVAERALKWAGIEFEMHFDTIGLPPRQETALALALREGITNIVRHAGATRVRGSLEHNADDVILTLADNGCGGGIEGNGLAGIRERIERLGGAFARTNADGTTLTVRLPLDKDELPAEDRPVPAATGALAP